MHTPEQVRELLEIIEIEDDKIEVLLKEQSLEQAHATIDIDLLVIYYNCFQYEETLGAHFADAGKLHRGMDPIYRESTG